MKAIDRSIIRIRAEDAQAAALWTLPVIKSKHVVGLQETSKEKTSKEADSTVFEEEVVVEKITLSELEKIRENAYREGLEQGRQEGVPQGIEEGREQGLKTGLAEGQTEIQTRLQQLEKMLIQLDKPLDDVSSEVEAVLVNMVLELSRAVVGYELSANCDAIRAAVNDAVAQLPQAPSQVRIVVNPQDIDDLREMVALHDHWMLVEDSELMPGGCRVTTSNTLVDNTVEQRFAAVAAQLKQKLIEGSLSEDPSDISGE